jgi:hypothetical protein
LWPLVLLCPRQGEHWEQPNGIECELELGRIATR